MAPLESEILAARLARMKGLIDSLEKVCSERVEQRALFEKLHAEMRAAREALKVYPPPGFD